MLSFFGLFLKFWTQIEESLLKNIVFIFESSPRILGLTVMLPLSCLWLLCRSFLLSYLPQFWSTHGRINSYRDESGRERPLQKLTAAPGITGGRHQGKMVWAWLTWVGKLKETVLHSTSAESALSCLGFQNQGVDTQASLLPTCLWVRGK